MPLVFRNNLKMYLSMQYNSSIIAAMVEQSILYGFELFTIKKNLFKLWRYLSWQVDIFWVSIIIGLFQQAPYTIICTFISTFGILLKRSKWLLNHVFQDGDRRAPASVTGTQTTDVIV